MIFDTRYHVAYDPIVVVQASALGGQPANIDIPVLMAYNGHLL